MEYFGFIVDFYFEDGGVSWIVKDYICKGDWFFGFILQLAFDVVFLGKKGDGKK